MKSHNNKGAKSHFSKEIIYGFSPKKECLGYIGQLNKWAKFEK